jgi:hypothetical protein
MITIEFKPPVGSSLALVRDGNIENWRSFEKRCRRDPIGIEYIEELSNGMWSNSRIAYIDENRVCGRFLSIELNEIKGTASAIIEPYGPLKPVLEAHIANIKDVKELVFLIRGGLNHIVTYDYMGPQAMYEQKREALREAQQKNRDTWWAR